MFKINLIVLILLSIFVITMIAAIPVMLCWNYVMPDLFNLSQIDFWHAWALSILCSALFKNTNTNTMSTKS